MTEQGETKEVLEYKLRHMKLSGMADQFRKQADDPNIGLETADERIAELTKAEPFSQEGISTVSGSFL